MRDLRASVANLVAADEALQRSSLPASPAIRRLIHSVIMVIGPLHDRAEPAYLEILKAPGLDNMRERRAHAEAAAVLAAARQVDQVEPQED